jgi:hypothetical protein
MANTTSVAAATRGSRGRRVATGVALLALGWTGALGGLSTSRASAEPTRENHCIAPSGTDLNELFGVSEQIVAPGSASCTEVGSGESFRPSVMPWFVNHTFEVVPDGFVAAGATPTEDFVAKFAAVKYVIDPGTKRAQTYRFPNRGNVWTGDFHGFALVNPLTLGTIRPQLVGSHSVETYWIFTAMHCDGFGDATGPGGNCFPAGATQLPTMQFTVTAERF